MGPFLLPFFCVPVVLFGIGVAARRLSAWRWVPFACYACAAMSAAAALSMMDGSTARPHLFEVAFLSALFVWPPICAVLAILLAAAPRAGVPSPRSDG